MPSTELFKFVNQFQVLKSNLWGFLYVERLNLIFDGDNIRTFTLLHYYIITLLHYYIIILLYYYIIILLYYYIIVLLYYYIIILLYYYIIILLNY